MPAAAPVNGVITTTAHPAVEARPASGEAPAPNPVATMRFGHPLNHPPLAVTVLLAQVCAVDLALTASSSAGPDQTVTNLRRVSLPALAGMARAGRLLAVAVPGARQRTDQAALAG